MYDVHWNPANPALFASCNNEGNIHLYDLAEDFDHPQVDLKVDHPAINKLMWNAEGSRLLAGDCQGSLNVLILDPKMMLFAEEKTAFLQEFIGGAAL